MLVSTTDTIPGKSYEILGLVRGGSIQTKNALRDIGSGLKGLAGGELKSYVVMMEKAQKSAMPRMVENAQALGSDAVFGVRYISSQTMSGAAELLAYGTAVRLL